MSINKVVLSGNICSDPDLKATNSGSTILAFRIAVNDRKKNKGGEWEDVPNYFSCYVFGNRANSVSKYVSKGTKVFIEGKLRWHQWTDNQGNKREDVDVIVDEIEWAPRANQTAPAATQPAPTPRRPAPAPKAPVFAPVADDPYASEDIPF